MAQVRSYRESDAEWEGIRASQEHAEKERKAKLTWQELVLEGLIAEEFRLNAELKKLQAIAEKITRTQNQIAYHREKIERYKRENGL